MKTQRTIEGYEPERRQVRLSDGKRVTLAPRQGKIFEGWLLGFRTHRRLAEFMTVNSGEDRRTARRNRDNKALEAFTEGEVASYLSRLRRLLPGLIPKLRGRRKNTK